MKKDSKNTHCVINGWLIDSATDSIIHQETKEVKRLGEFQFKLLLILSEHAGAILSKERLNSLVWEKRVIGQNSLPNAIHALRAALEDSGKDQKVIITVPRKGYLLEKAYCVLQTPAEGGDKAAAEIETTRVAPPTFTIAESSESLPQNESAYLQDIASMRTAWVTGPSAIKAKRQGRGLYLSLFMMVVSAFTLGVYAFTPSQAFSDEENVQECQSPYRLTQLSQPDTNDLALTKMLHLLKENG
ncbi:hypothetical protein SOASR030_23670 [Leminorella grimontii]|uniref:OmpR/PhoB-type domain-containing protein n=1 Tax=Leminorella grimontii TaxID=82981 RepID=A0AAV5N3W4_9GAMM|nr:winged helix-turn-helix domain-containing protein [Leminorella grimontii]KFC95146.1 signal transduction response regulator [Leminorella grimontii ATCC 33999 = DSM 5078]GKX56255.1 hypothetical protein SOASR030_23670 [Leminorella grimontii]GKX60436.1 hypothetical protein SOASR031_27510 [Leminorella grimontii]VFS60874.1 Transcriptional activator CadC [Leminorella grimontii]